MAFASILIIIIIAVTFSGRSAILALAVMPSLSFLQGHKGLSVQFE